MPTETLNHLAIIVQFLAALFVGMQLIFLTREASRTRIQQKKLTTLDYLSKHFDDNQEFYHWVNNIQPERLAVPQNFTAKERALVIDYLTLTERMAAGVRHNIIDIDFILDTHGKGFRRNFLKLYAFIRYIRDEVESSPRKWDMYEFFALELERRSAEKILPLKIREDMERNVRRNNKLTTTKI